MYAQWPEQDPELGRQNAQTRRVVVAEDDEVFRALLCDLLRECAIEVCEARDGVELLEILAQSAAGGDNCQRIDLIVSDVCVPEYSSIELILGMHAAKMKIPLIAITAFGERRSQVLAHHHQDITLEEEAFDLDGFRAMVLDLLRNRSAPASRRITLRPTGMTSQRPTGMPDSASENSLSSEILNVQLHARASSPPPAAFVNLLTAPGC